MTSQKEIRLDYEEFRGQMIEAFEGRVQDLSRNTEFTELAEWDSLVSISTLAMIYIEYDVQISGDELVSCRTLGDLMALVDGKCALAA